MRFDSILFDVDGVLVDIRKSYNETIRHTVELVINQLSNDFQKVHSSKPSSANSSEAANRPLRRKPSLNIRRIITDRLILRFRQSGGFNNDTDTSYAITLALLVNPQRSNVSASRYLSKIAENSDETGISSVESFLDKQSHGIAAYKKALAYPPDKTTESPLARVFDELFYGPVLFRKQNKAEPKYFVDKGRKTHPMIKNDKVAITERTLRTLSKELHGNLAMVTGRSKVASEYSLGKLMRYFNSSGCVFLEDEPRAHAKPNPYGIIHAMKMMNAKNAVYAGDSTEDLLMAKRAVQYEPSLSITFVGIYGFSPLPFQTANRFKQSGVPTARDVNQLPTIIQKLQG